VGGEGWTSGTIGAALFGIWATFALDVFSTLNSSPQTTELFAGDREDSLMHWVLIGDAVAIGGGAAAAIASKKAWPIIAVVVVVIMMHLFYKHAVARGTGQAPPDNASGY
jgi:hypothetical protein